MKKQAVAKASIDAEVKRSFQAWMKGQSFAALKKRAGKPLMAAFTTLAGATTWRQAKARRDKAAKKARVA